MPVHRNACPQAVESPQRPATALDALVEVAEKTACECALAKRRVQNVVRLLVGLPESPEAEPTPHDTEPAAMCLYERIGHALDQAKRDTAGILEAVNRL